MSGAENTITSQPITQTSITRVLLFKYLGCVTVFVCVCACGAVCAVDLHTIHHPDPDV